MKQNLIDVDKLWADIEYWENHDDPKKPDYDTRDIEQVIGFQPIVEAIPVRHGKWVRNDNRTYSCSECKSWIPNEQHYYARYCLFCGAKMDEEKENEQKSR